MAKVTGETIYDLIEKWHEGESELQLHEYLGLTWEQYAHWVQTDELPNN